MIKIAVQCTDAPQAVEWVRSAIDAKIAQLKLAMRTTERRLAEFESKYQTDSQTFLTQVLPKTLRAEIRNTWNGTVNIKSFRGYKHS